MQYAFYLYLITIGFMTLPFASNRPWAWSILQITLFIITGTILALKKAPLSVSLKTTSFRVAGLCFLFIVGWITLQAVLGISVDPSLTYQECLKALSYLCIFYLTIVLIDTRNRLLVTIYTVMFVGLFQAFLGTYWVIIGDHSRAAGTYVNANHFAGFLEMTISLGVGLMIAYQTKTKSQWRSKVRGYIELLLGPRARIRIALVILVIGLVLSASRMGNTALFASIFLSACITLTAARHLSRSTVIFLISLVIVDLALISTYFGVDRVMNRVQQTTLQTEQRDDIVKDAIPLLLDNAITGTGAGTFQYVFPQYRSPNISNYFKHAENDYLEFLIELGLIGFIPLALIVLLSLTAAIQTLRQRRSQFMRGIAFGCIMGIIAILIHSLADFNLRIPANACLFAIILALSHVTLNLERRSSSGGTQSGSF